MGLSEKVYSQYRYVWINSHGQHRGTEWRADAPTIEEFVEFRARDSFVYGSAWVESRTITYGAPMREHGYDEEAAALSPTHRGEADHG